MNAPRSVDCPPRGAHILGRPRLGLGFVEISSGRGERNVYPERHAMVVQVELAIAVGDPDFRIRRLSPGESGR